MAVPKLRYPEFQGEWDKITLGDKLSFKNGVNASRNAFRSDGYKCIGVSDVYKCLPLTDEAIIGTVALTQKEAERYIVNNGDLLFQRSSETQEDIGHVSAYIGNGNVVFNGFVICGKPLEPFYDPVFMHYELQTSRVRSETVRLGAGAQHYNIGQESLSKITAYIPTIIEQQKITDFFTAVDKMISACQDEIENLEQQKKAVMQKIFSREIRFKREDGTEFPEWESDKWSELGEFIGSGTLSKADLSEKGVPCILYGELYTKYSEIAHTIYSKTKATKHVFSKKDDVILPKSGETPEDISTATCIPYDNISLGGDLIVFRHNDRIIGSYLSYLISNNAKKAIASIAQWKSVVHISEKALERIELIFPCIEEQQKISDFLSEYDTAIQAAKDELTKWQEMKKGLLQQMFV